MFKRIFLFIMTNILIMVTITTILNLLGVQNYLTAKGINYSSLAIYCLIWGFVGAFISLALSKIMAKWMMHVEIIDPLSSNPEHQWLIQTTNRLSQAANLPTPEVGIYDAEDINAFATGPSKSNSLIAVSTGLLSKMNRAEAEAVLAHEVAHIANGDMITMTLLQGLVNAFGMFLARLLGFALSQAVDEEKQPMVRMISTFVFDILLSILGLFVVSYFSRQREFRADKAASNLVGSNKMIAALEKLKLEYEFLKTSLQNEETSSTNNSAIASLQISNNSSRWLDLLSTHPKLDDRIQKLKGL